MRAWSEWGLWSYAATATQSNAGGGVVNIDVTAGVGNVIHILFARAVGAFTAADTLLFATFDEDNVQGVAYGAVSGSASPILTLPRAATNIDSTTTETTGTSLGGVWLAGADQKFTVNTTALAVNDTVQLLLVAKVKKGRGTISVSRSGGTVAAPTETVNEVY